MTDKARETAAHHARQAVYHLTQARAYERDVERGLEPALERAEREAAHLRAEPDRMPPQNLYLRRGAHAHRYIGAGDHRDEGNQRAADRRLRMKARGKKGERRMFCGRCGSTDLSVYYPTPEAVGREVIAYASIDRADLTVLEPSAGTGDLARLAAETGAAVDCVELQPSMATELKKSGRYRTVAQGDFLARPPKAIYDRVVMNPPFERGADIDHVEHAVRFLVPGGVLVAVVSAMTGKRANRKADQRFARLLDTMGTGRMRLPEGAFREVGTDVTADLVRLERAAS